jgi:hypothetical protein
MPLSQSRLRAPASCFTPAEQWGYIRDFHKELDEVWMKTCSRCQERWDLKDGICHSYFSQDKGNKTPFLMSAENDMDSGELPTHLPELPQVEEMVIGYRSVTCADDGLSIPWPPVPLHRILCEFPTERCSLNDNVFECVQNL